MAWDWRFKRGDKNWLGRFFPKKRFGKIVVFFMLKIMIIGAWSFLHYAPFKILARPETAPQKTYDYYIIVDKETEVILMYVPVIVRAGDELVSEDNKRYVVIEVVDDVAYARFVENIVPK